MRDDDDLVVTSAKKDDNNNNYLLNDGESENRTQGIEKEANCGVGDFAHSAQGEVDKANCKK